MRSHLFALALCQALEVVDAALLVLLVPLQEVHQVVAHLQEHQAAPWDAKKDRREKLSTRETKQEGNPYQFRERHHDAYEGVK